MAAQLVRLTTRAWVMTILASSACTSLKGDEMGSDGLTADEMSLDGSAEDAPEDDTASSHDTPGVDVDAGEGDGDPGGSGSSEGKSNNAGDGDGNSGDGDAGLDASLGAGAGDGDGDGDAVGNGSGDGDGDTGDAGRDAGGVAVCGDGARQGAEACDDGNAAADDGCYECQVESGWECTSSPPGCSDINECATDHGGCDPLVTCTNTPGSRTCGACPANYVGDGYSGCSCTAGLWGPDCSLCVVRVAQSGGSDANEGDSWASALATVQAGIDRARARLLQDGLSTCDVWVAAGTYTPSPSDASIAIQLRAGVGLYGGFDGTENDRSERQATVASTVLSGDLAGDDQPGNLTLNRSDNSAVIVNSEVDGAVLDGFALRSGGTALQLPPTLSSQVSNCEFQYNSGYAIKTADGGVGGAVAIADSTFVNNGGTAVYTNHADFTVTDSSFSFNANVIHISSRTLSVLHSYFSSNTGKCIVLIWSTNSALIDNEFFNNTATVVSVTDVSPVAVISSTFFNNRATNGAVLSAINGSVQFIGSLLYENTATGQGGCFYLSGGPASVTVINSTLVSNSALSGGGSVVYGGSSHHASFTNSIVWGNKRDIVAGSLMGVAYASSIIQDVTASGTVLDVDPLFVVDPTQNSSGDVHLQASSPAIGAGDASKLPLDTLDIDDDGNVEEPLPLDLDGKPRTRDTLDLGAYEYQGP